MLRKLGAAICVMVLFVGWVRAAEPAPEGPAVETVEIGAAAGEASPWWLDAAEAGLNSLWKLIIPVFFAWAIKKAHDSAVLKDGLRALEAGVNDAWVNFVQELKKKASDGKLTADEKNEARAWAINKAKEVATGSGRRLLVGMGQMALESLVSKIVRKRKSGG